MPTADPTSDSASGRAGHPAANGTVPSVLPVAAIIPCRDSPWIASVVGAVMAGRCVPQEILVVDDGSRKPVAPLPPARVIRTPGLGRGAARNVGARQTGAPLLWFVDADVLIGEATLALLHSALADGLDGTMAVYSDRDRSGYEGFRLAHHRWQVLRNPEPRHLSAACLLLRRSCYEELGGFPDLSAMEDVALGVAGTRLGFRWRSVPAATVVHLPRHDALAVLARDYRERGVAAVRLAAHEGLVLEHAASPRELVAGVGSMAFLASLPMPRRLRLSRNVGVVALSAWLLADWPWLRYAARRKGWRFAVSSLGWLVVFRAAVASGVVRGILSGPWWSSPWP